MKLLILNIYFHPDPTGTGLVITELARDLVAQGHEVTVITSVPHYGGVSHGAWCKGPGARFPGPGHRTWGTEHLPPRLWSEETLDGIRVIRTAVYIPRRPTFWTRALNYLTFCALATLAGLRCGRHEVIMCTSPPLPLGVSAWVLALFKRVPLLFNVQDIYPDVAILMGVLKNRAFIGLSRWLERFVYQRAALVTVISESARRNLEGKGVPPAKIAVIPNWVDVDYVCPISGENEFRRKVMRPTSKLVMFAGNIGLIAGLETVLEAAAMLRHRPDIHFLVVGEGNAKAALVTLAQRMDLPNVTFLPTQPREILPQVLGSADIHLVTLKRRLSNTSVPSKSYGIMASERPMIAAVDPDSEVWRLVEEAECGLCVPPEEPLALAQAIEALCDSPEQRQRMGENARRYVVRHHAKRELTTLYGRTLERIAGVTRATGRPITVDVPAKAGSLTPGPSPSAVDGEGWPKTRVPAPPGGGLSAPPGREMRRPGSGAERR
jgi:colanic acid biosynthesis glycosyl transferase WcaI